MADREKLIELVHNARMNALWHNAQKPSEYITDMLIEDGVTVRERGRWIEDRDGDEYCENCSRYMPIREVTGDPSAHNYCPNCGADMRGEEDG